MIEKTREILNYLAPVSIIKRPDSLVIIDMRPTLFTLLSVLGVIGFAGGALVTFLKFDLGLDAFGFWAMGIFGVIFLALSFKCSIREIYRFDKTTDSYAFTRQFLHRKEVIEGTLSQFRGVEVQSNTVDDRTTHSVALLQDGMFLYGASEQKLREVPPLLNFRFYEERIANAISSFLQVKRDDYEG